MKPRIRIGIVAIVFLFSSNLLFAQEHLTDSFYDSHAGQVLGAFERTLESQPSNYALELAYARAAEDYGFLAKAKAAFNAYLEQNSQDADARIDYAVLLCHGDSSDRQGAYRQAKLARLEEPEKLNVLRGILTVALVHLDSMDWRENLDSLIEGVAEAADNLKKVAGSQDKFLSFYADSTLRWLKHFNDSQADMDEEAGSEYISIDKELNHVYRELLKNEDTVARNRLIEAQRAWLKYRDAQMLAFYPYKDSADQYYGSIFPVCWSSSLGSLEQIRLDELKEWIKSSDDEGDVCSGAYAIANVAKAFQTTRVRNLKHSNETPTNRRP